MVSADSPARTRPWTWPIRILWLGYAAASSVGLVGWLAADPVIETPAYVAGAPATGSGALSNLAALSRGGRVRVSSYHWFRSHHPLYLIDEYPRPSRFEKWVSAGAKENQRPAFA